MQFLIQQNSILERTIFLYNKINNIQNLKNNLTQKKIVSNNNLEKLTLFIQNNKETLNDYEKIQQKLATLNEKKQSLQQKYNIIQKNKTELNNINTKIQQNQQEYIQLKKDVGFCPYCLTVFTDPS